MIPASSNALAMPRKVIGNGVSQLTTAAAIVAKVPARITEYPMNSATIRMMIGMNR